MSRQFSFKKQLNWKGIGYTVVVFLFIYYLPVTLASKFLPSGSNGAAFISVWLFAGLVILSAITSYIFNISVSESAFAAILTLFVGLVILWLFFQDSISSIELVILSSVIMASLAMFGSWIGNKFRI